MRMSDDKLIANLAKAQEHAMWADSILDDVPDLEEGAQVSRRTVHRQALAEVHALTSAALSSVASVELARRLVEAAGPTTVHLGTGGLDPEKMSQVFKQGTAKQPIVPNEIDAEILAGSINPAIAWRGMYEDMRSRYYAECATADELRRERDEAQAEGERLKAEAGKVTEMVLDSVRDDVRATLQNRAEEGLGIATIMESIRQNDEGTGTGTTVRLSLLPSNSRQRRWQAQLRRRGILKATGAGGNAAAALEDLEVELEN